MPLLILPTTSCCSGSRRVSGGALPSTELLTNPRRWSRRSRAVDQWEDRLALLTEFLPDTGPASAHVWKRIEQGLARDRLAMPRLLLWKVTTAVLAFAVVALLVRLAGG